MLKIAPCIFHRNKLDRQVDPAVLFSHADGLVKRTKDNDPPKAMNHTCFLHPGNSQA
jgi:hypothetical protein